MISIKSQREVQVMKESCLLAAQTLSYIEKKLEIGMSTLEINDLCHDFIVSKGARPSPLNYRGFPKSVCTSLNEVICHGIPSKKDRLKDGDLLNIDVTTHYKGFHGDTNKTFLIGNVSPEHQRLVEVTYLCLEEAIKLCRPGARLGDIGNIIETIAHDHGLSVVHEYCGHGIGREFHEEPQILHYGKKGTGIEMKKGMTFTIEPMINLGRRHCRLLKDDWTVVTKDKKYSAQFEHTIVITEEGHEIMTWDPERVSDKTF